MLTMTLPRLAALAALALLAALPARADEDARPPAAIRRVETPNGALSFALPAGWTARPLKSGVALEPPGNPLDETIVIACEPYAVPREKTGLAPFEDLFERLRAGQLATVESSPRPSRETLKTASGVATIITYKGTDDGGKPAALTFFVLPSEGRVGILTARIPWRRLAERWTALNGVVDSFAIVPAASEKALVKRLAGTWRSDAAPTVALRFLADGTFEEQREAGANRPVAERPSQKKGGSFELIGREVRLRFDEGESRAFKIDAEQPGEFTSAGQTWRRIAD